MSDFDKIKTNIEKLRGDMGAYPKARLCAVIKNRTPEEIRYAIDSCGVTLVGENRVQEISSITRNLKIMAKELKCPSSR